MADNIALPAVSGTVATDQVGTEHYQKIKLYSAGADVAVPYGDTDTGGSTRALHTEPRRYLVRTQTNSAGLTTSTTAYSAGDQLGTILTVAGQARATGRTGLIHGAVLIDRAKIIGAVNLYIYRATVTLAADNAAFDVSDADQDSLVGVIALGTPRVLGSNGVTTAYNLGMPYDCAATSLFIALETVSGHTFFGAVSDLRLTLITEQF
jgi:hypothetical protein